MKQIYITNDIETLKLPVPLSDYDIKSSKNSTSTILLGFGEINDSGTPALKTWSVSSFFPNQDYKFVQGTRKSNPYDYVKLIEKLKDNNTICRFIMTKTNINISCTIEDFSYGEKDGTGDIYYTISFKEHKEISI